MSKYLIYIILIFWGFVSCNNKTQNNAASNSEEDKIITTVFDTLIGQDINWRKHRLLPLKNYLQVIPPQLKEPQVSRKEFKADSEEYSRFVDSMCKRLDTAKLYVFVNDSLIVFPTFEKEQLAPKTKSGRSYGDFLDTDVEYRSLMIALLDSISPRKFKISEITSKYHYSIEYADRKRHYRLDTIPKKVVSVAALMFSRAVINKDTSKAVLFMNWADEGGYLFYLNKTNGFWKVTKRVNLWSY